MPSGKGYEITFDGVSSTTIPEFMCHQVHRTLLGANRSVVRATAGREGAWFFPEKRGLRQIQIEASVLTTLSGGSFPGDRRDAVEKVSDWVDKNGFKKLIIGDKPDRFYRAHLVTEVDVDEWRHKGSFSLEFEAEPYAYANTASTESFSLNRTGTPHTFTMPDKIDAYPVVELKAVGGTLANLTLNVNGYQLVMAPTIASGATVTVNSISFTTATGANTDTDLEGAFDVGTIAMVGVSGFFPILVADNTDQSFAINASGTATSVDVTVHWRRKYR